MARSLFLEGQFEFGIRFPNLFICIRSRIRIHSFIQYWIDYHCFHCAHFRTIFWNLFHKKRLSYSKYFTVIFYAFCSAYFLNSIICRRQLMKLDTDSQWNCSRKSMKLYFKKFKESTILWHKSLKVYEISHWMSMT